MQDRRELNVHDLDEVSKEHPVVVQHRGGHVVLQRQGARDGGYHERVMRLLPKQVITVVPAGAGVGVMKEQYGRSQSP